MDFPRNLDSLGLCNDWLETWIYCWSQTFCFCLRKNPESGIFQFLIETASPQPGYLHYRCSRTVKSLFFCKLTNFGGIAGDLLCNRTIKFSTHSVTESFYSS